MGRGGGEGEEYAGRIGALAPEGSFINYGRINYNGVCGRECLD